MKDPFVKLPVVSVKEVPNPDYDPKEAENPAYVVPAKVIKVERFDMRVRPRFIAAYNPVTEAPEDSGIMTTVYFSVDSKLPQLFTSLDSASLDMLLATKDV